MKESTQTEMRMKQMSNSPLVDYVLISPHRNSPRNDKIRKITIHHMAGNLSVEECGRLFQTRKASSNYGIDSKGRVGMYVEEKDRSWCSASPWNDHQAITIEVADDTPDWHVSDIALAKLIDLCVDICVRNDIKELIYTGDTDGNLTRHNMFCATICPAPYLQSKFPWIASEVNRRLRGEMLVRLKIGFASRGDIKTFIVMLDGMGIGFTEKDGFIETEWMTETQAVLVEEKADSLIVPCVVIESKKKDEDPDDYKEKYEQTKKDLDDLKARIKEISIELAELSK